MGSYDHRGLSLPDIFINQSFFLCRIRTGKKNNRNIQPLFPDKCLKRLKVLAGKNLCGHHKRRLVSVFKGQDHGKKGKDRLSASHISLHQPGHQRLPGKIPLDLMPGIQLGAGKPVGKIFDHLLCCPCFFHGKQVLCLLCFFFQKLNRKNKKQKLVKYQPFSRHKKLIHIFRKMNGAKRIINIRKLIFFLNLFRQIFTFQRLLFQKLMKQLHNCFIGKSCRKPVNRLKAVEDLLIGCRGENFRMFHLKLTLPPDHPASEYKNTSLFQSIFQIGSIKPGNRKPAAAVTYCHGDYLLSSYRIYINAGTYCSGDGFYRPLFKICNICRRFILVIIPGIIPEILCQKYLFSGTASPFFLLLLSEFLNFLPFYSTEIM